MIALVLALALQATEVSVIPAMPSPPPAPESMTSWAFNYSCNFADADGRQLTIVLERRGGRGFATGDSKFPARHTPYSVRVLSNNSGADVEGFSEIQSGSKGSQLELITRNGSEIVALLRVSDDWSWPDVDLDSRAAASLSWGSTVDNGTSRWLEHSLEGECALEKIVQEPLSATEASEFLSK